MPQTLSAMRVLVVDCQTTGASPAHGHLLEVGWHLFRPGDADSPPAEERLVRLPDGTRVPGPIARLTGISEDDMKDAVDRKDLWQALCREASHLREENRGIAPAVAHFARFEAQFLRHLGQECDGESSFPLRFICTHEIGKRLFPDLPRRGLRALAGYFGSPLPELKRAGSHVAATAAVWSHLVRMLDDDGVSTMDDLFRFLSRPAPSRGPKWRVPLDRDRRLALPDLPGVYRFLGGDGRVLYVGKATSLRTRVNSYYRRRRAEEKVLELVSQVRDVQTTITASALEAALLETEEIKRLDPPYNRALRDRGQGIWFFDPALLDPRGESDDRHRIGPVPGRELLRSVGQLARLLGSDDPGSGDEPSHARDLGLRYASLEPGALAGGLVRFRKRHGLRSGAPRPGQLLSLGTRLWRERLDREPTGDEPPADDDAGGEDRTDSIDTDGVADHLEEVIAQGARSIRRGRWLRLLADASISWTTAPPDAGDRRRLVLEEGRVVRQESVDASPEPVRPRSDRRDEDRTRLDRPGYDRLRVLSTELRRLVSRRRNVDVLLGSGRRLDAPRLEKALRML